MQDFLQKKDEKIKEQRRILDFQEELEIHKEQKRKPKNDQLYICNTNIQFNQQVDSSTFLQTDEFPEKIKSFQCLSKQELQMVARMQIDIQRRRLKHDTKLKMKEYEQSKELCQMFTPKINKKKRTQSQSKDQSSNTQDETDCSKFLERVSVYERMNFDAERRRESVSKRNKEQEDQDQQTQHKSSMKSLSRERSQRKLRKMVFPSDHEQKLREALTKGISAIDLWKFMGDNPVNSNQNKSSQAIATLNEQYFMSKGNSICSGEQIVIGSQSVQIEQDQKHKSMGKLLASSSIKNISAIERKICPGQPQTLKKQDSKMYQQVQQKLVEKNRVNVQVKNQPTKDTKISQNQKNQKSINRNMSVDTKKSRDKSTKSDKSLQKNVQSTKSSQNPQSKHISRMDAEKYANKLWSQCSVKQFNFFDNSKNNSISQSNADLSLMKLNSYSSLQNQIHHNSKIASNFLSANHLL
ncbi:UNKNOWN [Stylonychia lemnae]|uniref:Uncharacterized protein n=1 Tax=Stylonychia lemnae TaxID=5949 RepID=A0A078BBK3_STYLE|nr:UNKNOWN [Stylonychia lemnae]|eukprot:CDW90647.1 UNKNOWN [Stylonychia lemnae]